MNAKAELPIVPSRDPAALLELAIEKNVDVNQLEKLMALYERWQNGEKEKEVNRDLAEFREECPPIEKNKEVKKSNGDLLYRYASLDNIIDTVRPVLKKHGFTFDFDTERAEDGALNVTCFLRHRSGFTRKSTFPVPAIQGSHTNQAQDEGSKTTFGRRYALQNVLGISPEDDDDGQAAMPENLVWLVKHNDVVRENLQSILAIKDALAVEDEDAAAEVVAEMSKPDWDTLWRAPRSGGMWTTQEKATMKAKAFADNVHAKRKDSGWYNRPENQV